MSFDKNDEQKKIQISENITEQASVCDVSDIVDCAYQTYNIKKVYVMIIDRAASIKIPNYFMYWVSKIKKEGNKYVSQLTTMFAIEGINGWMQVEDNGDYTVRNLFPVSFNSGTNDPIYGKYIKELKEHLKIA